MATDSSRHEAKIRARRGEAALLRYLTGPEASQDAEYAAAVQDLTLAFQCLADDDPMRADVAFHLGVVRLAAHDKRCGKPCPVAGEFAPIVELIGVAGARPGASARQLSLYAIVADRLYDHSCDPADIDRAIEWLGVAARDRRLADADRRRMLINIAIQQTNRGEVTRVSDGRSGPGTESWAAFDAAIRQFDEVLTKVARRGGRRDGARATDRLDAWLGQLETYYQRGGDAARDEDLGIMAGLARNLVTEMAPRYHVRAYALGRAGTTLILRLTRLLGDPWDLALNSMALSSRPDAMSAAAGRVPGFGPDIELAIGALTQAARLADPADRRQQVYTAALFAAHCMRYLAFLEEDDLGAIGRLGRAVMGHPQADPGYRRHCGEWLLLVLARRVAGTEAGAGPGSLTGWAKPSPSADGDLDTMLGLLAAFAAEDGARLAPALSAFLTDSVLTRTEGDLSAAELSAEYARARVAAAGLAGVPAAHAVLILRAAEIGAELIYRGVAPAGMADEVAEAFSAARLGLPAGHPLVSVAAARAAAFESARRMSSGQGAPPSGPAVPLGGDAPAPTGPAEELPPVLDVFSVRALAALGVGTEGWLTGTPACTTEAAALLVRQASGVSRAAVLSVLALAQYATWVRERAGNGLGGSLDNVRTAIAELPAGHPLCARLTMLLARMLLDRAQLGGDLADADAALTLLDGLRMVADTQPALAGLGELLTQAGPSEMSGLLAAPLAGQLSTAGELGFRLDLDAAVGSGLLLRSVLTGSTQEPQATGSPRESSRHKDGRGGGDLRAAIAILRGAVGALSDTDPRRPDLLSDLGLALLAAGQGWAGARSAGTELGGREQVGPQPAAVDVLREAAATVVGLPSHPRRAAILLRTAAALAAAEWGAAGAAARGEHAVQGAGYHPHAVDEGIGLLTQALSEAGLVASGERSRCLYGLGSVLLVRFSRTWRDDDLSAAISRLEEARAGVEAVPGDPFLVPLLRALAWAHRQNAYRLAHDDGRPAGDGRARAGEPRLPLHRSRSTGRSVLYAHAQSVLLQSGSRYALAASRAIGRDALTLAEWCVADGRPDSAVEALELGRALVLHAATVAADVPALLREAGRRDLAVEWDGQASAAAQDIDAVPGDLRGRVLAALRTGVADRRLLAAPPITGIASALRAAGLDALAYLIPASGAVRGRALTVGADGTARELPLPGLAATPGTPLARFAAADYEFRATRLPAEDPPDVAAAKRFRRELDVVCDWAWTAAIGPLIDQFAPVGQGRGTPQIRPLRLAIVPIGLLGLVPWHAARREEAGKVRYACADVIFTTCASARQLIEAVGRQRLAPAAGPAVFVANPTGDLPGSQLEADAICGAFYHDAVYLGRSARTPVSGAGSPAEVLACLPGHPVGAIRPAVLHLGCHARAADSPEESRLALAGGGALPVSRILEQARRREHDERGGLVVLAACTSDLTLADYDEALTLASAFLAAGATGAVGARWSVDDQFTAPLMFMFHRHLVRSPGDGPAGALRAAQLWMLDPRRELPPEMPGEFAGLMSQAAASQPYAWAAFTCHGQ